MQRVYFDTYALIELSKANPRYAPYKAGVRVLLNKLNLMEYSCFLLREGKAAECQPMFDRLARCNVDYDDAVLLEAARMKTRLAREKLSFIDCIGYLLAKQHDAVFLTGDEKFKDKDNVLFVK